MHCAAEEYVIVNGTGDRRRQTRQRPAGEQFSDSFRDTVMAGGVKPLKLSARSLNDATGS